MQVLKFCSPTFPLIDLWNQIPSLAASLTCERPSRTPVLRTNFANFNIIMLQTLKHRSFDFRFWILDFGATALRGFPSQRVAEVPSVVATGVPL
ncbi:hypothetical protein B4U84_10050 [Westiellopsis prolifica IICB1]|nr:hypothetical protein B4U84_10050 [Westiellopsis prolifica IICB1]